MSSDYTFQAGPAQVELVKGDITRIRVDAIVNAANAALAGGGGVDGAIHRAGGPAIMKELDKIRAAIGRCETGQAVATSAGNLPAQYVFHAVGPIYQDGRHGEEEMLRSCYETCLRLAVERDVSSISFPSISSGVYGYPIQDAAEVALRTVVGWLREHSGPVQTVKFVQFSEQAQAVYREKVERVLKAAAAGTNS